MLRHFYNEFMAFVPLQLPQLLNVATMEQPQFYNDYVLLTFPLSTPIDLEEVMDIIIFRHNTPRLDKPHVLIPILLSDRCSK